MTTETCCCGASVTSGNWATVGNFRSAHASCREAWAAKTSPPPGPCWHDSQVTWPGETYSVRCDLLAGHAGAHQADRGSHGGTAVWTDATLPTEMAAATAAAASELEESK